MFSKQVVYLSITFIFNVLETDGTRHNSCKDYSDYYFIDFSKNCYYNPDVFAPTTEILTRHVGTYETHTVTTEDGYILNMFRIPKDNPKGVVILQNPLGGASSIYVSQNNESLAFLMADQGYDVWIPGNRGTPYSDKHVNLTSSDPEYWNFSFHEIGLYDYSAIIIYIKDKTRRSDIIYIGHSMGSTASMIYASLKPIEAKNSIKIFINMAPPVYMKNTGGLIRLLAPFAPVLEKLTNSLHIVSSFTSGSLEANLWKKLVDLPFKKQIVLFQTASFGWTPNEFDPELINLIISQYPRACSMKTLYHYAQIINSGGKFRMYDYGEKKNTLSYGSITPPEYPVENVTVPVYLITSSSDLLATIKDSEFLYNKLPDEATIYGKLDVDEINHIDFFVGKHRKSKIYDPIFSLLDRIQ